MFLLDVLKSIDSSWLTSLFWLILSIAVVATESEDVPNPHM